MRRGLVLMAVALGSEAAQAQTMPTAPPAQTMPTAPPAQTMPTAEQVQTIPTNVSDQADATPQDLAPEGRAVEVDLGGMIFDGSRRRMRELARTPTFLWGAARLFAPVDWRLFRGRLLLEITTMGTGRFDLDGHLPDDARLVLHFSRFRFPFAAESRIAAPPLAIDANALDNLEQTREEALLRYERALGPAEGRLYVRLDFQRLAGNRPMLTTGLVSGSPLIPAFGNPAFRGTDDMTGGAQVGYSNAPRGVRILVQGGFRYDGTTENWTIRDRFGDQPTGLLALHETMRRRTLDLLVSAANDEPAVLMAGASYRVAWTANGPRTQRTEQQTGFADGTINGQDMRVTVVRNQVALGAAWRPVPQLRLAGRLDGRVNDLDGDGVQARNLGTLQTVRTDSSRQDWTVTGRLDGSYTIIPALTLQLDARGEIQNGQDNWALLYLVPATATTAGERLRLLDRQRLLGSIELALATRLGTRWRVTVGSRLEGLHTDEDVKELVDAFLLGDRGRTRWGAFVAARARPLRRLLVNVQASVFRNTWDQSQARDLNWRTDARLRGTVLLGPFTIFALGAFTEDNHQLSGPNTTVLPGFAPIDFEGRSWLALGGASVGLSRTSWASATYSHLINTADLTTRLQDIAAAGSWQAPWKRLRLGATARYLSFHDSARPWDNGKAVLLLGTAGAPF